MDMRKRCEKSLLGMIGCVAAVLLGACFVVQAAPASAFADEGVPIYRMYDANTGEHLYTSDVSERDTLYDTYGWGYEGVAWYAPSSGDPIYRLYNPYLGNHLYTSDMSEIESLTSMYDWQVDNADEPLFYSGGSVSIYRMYNESLSSLHLLTTDFSEYCALPAYDWSQEGEVMAALSLGVTFESTRFYPMRMEPTTAEGYPIMGQSDMDVDAMVRCYTWREGVSGQYYPADVYASYGAPTIYDFCSILVNEAETEGVAAEVVFAQAMWETGWLQFSGSDVQAKQCNFAGLGVYGGSTGLDFSDYGDQGVRMGFRYQVQLLKTYASTKPLVNECICPTYTWVNGLVDDGVNKFYRGCSPTLQMLDGIWAGEGYGDNMESFIYYLESHA